MYRIVLIIGAMSLGICSNVVASDFESSLKQLAEGEEKFCAKADLFSLKFSVRSFSGRACNDPKTAALAEMICPVKDIDNYLNSGCHEKAVKALDGRIPLLVLIEELKKSRDEYEKIVCPAGEISESAKSACELLRMAKKYLSYLK